MNSQAHYFRESAVFLICDLTLFVGELLLDVWEGFPGSRDGLGTFQQDIGTDEVLFGADAVCVEAGEVVFA